MLLGSLKNPEGKELIDFIKSHIETTNTSLFLTRDANTGSFANWISVVENQFKTDFWFYWPS